MNERVGRRRLAKSRSGALENGMEVPKRSLSCMRGSGDVATSMTCVLKSRTLGNSVRDETPEEAKSVDIEVYDPGVGSL